MLYPLNSLKLVCACKPSTDYDQLLLKEYIIYKIYNLLTEKSFRVRLLNINYQDSGGRKKTIAQHAFLVEDVKDMAKRNNCMEWKKGGLNTEATDRRQMTTVAIFEYMIGNTDWAVRVNHNTKLILSKEDSTSKPFVVPYDFDYSGLVNTDYAIPDEKLDIENVQQRLYRGFSRKIEELNEVLQIFKEQKEKIYSIINNFELLTAKNRKEMIFYLEGFYGMINKPAEVKYIFIENARSQ